MLSWDDFRIVKAIADRGSLAEAAKALRINQSTVFRKLGQIEHRIGARLFKRNRTEYGLTPRGEEMVRLADRMEQDVATFERGLSAKTSMEKTFVTGVVPMDQIMGRTGLEFLTDVVDGLWLLTHSDLRATARVRAFMDFAGAEIAKRRKQLEGTG